jgi:hypothetical protein
LAPQVKYCSPACLVRKRERAARMSAITTLVERNLARDAIERGLACAVRRPSDAGI